MTNDTNTESTVRTIIAQRGHSQALAFARKGGTALSSLLAGIAKRKEEESKGPIETMHFLETHFSSEEGHRIPVVGSKMGETGNNPYDRYTVEITTSDGKRKVPGSWFTDVVKSTEVWSELNQRREWIKQAQGEGVPADILAMKAGERALEKKRIDQFIANMRTALTRGAMLLHQVDAVASMNPARVKVKLPLHTFKDDGGKEEERVTGSLIRLQDPSGIDEEDEVVTVGQFLQYKPELAAKDPDKGTITSLKATAARAPKKKGGSATLGQGTAYVAPSTLEQVLTLFNVLATGIDQESDEGEKVYAKLLSQVSKEGAEGDEAIVSIGKVCLACDALWTIVRPRYMKIAEKKAKVAMTGT